MAAKRIRSKIAKTDIENAIRVWLDAWYQSIGPEGATKDDLANEKAILAANGRITAWLKQVDADQARLHKAMLACQALDVANNDADVRQATKLAREAIES